MDIKLEKYELLEWLLSIEDEELISELKDIKEKNSSDPEEVQLSEIEELFIEAGLKDIEEGRVFSHDEVLKEIKQLYGL